MRAFSHALSRLSTSASALTLLFLLIFDAASSAFNPLPVLFPHIYRDLKGMSMVAKLPEFLNAPGSPPDVLMLVSSMILFPAVRCDDAIAGRKDRYDPWYFNIHILGYSRADYLQNLLSKELHRQLSVANLGIAAAMVSDSYAIFQKTLSFGKKPRVLVLAVAPRDFLDRDHRQAEKTATFQILADFTSFSEFLTEKPRFEDTVDFLAKATSHLYKIKDQYRACLVSQTADILDRPINLYSAASLAHGWDKAANAHCFTQAVHKKPRRFVADAQHTVDLMRADSLLAGGHKEQRGKPLGERNLAELEHGLDRDRELLTAGCALVQAGAMGLAL